MNNHLGNAIMSAAAEFRKAATLSGISIWAFGAGILNSAGDETQPFAAFIAFSASALAGGGAIHRGLSGLAKSHQEAQPQSKPATSIPSNPHEPKPAP